MKMLNLKILQRKNKEQESAKKKQKITILTRLKLKRHKLKLHKLKKKLRIQDQKIRISSRAINNKRLIKIKVSKRCRDHNSSNSSQISLNTIILNKIINLPKRSSQLKLLKRNSILMVS